MSSQSYGCYELLLDINKAKKAAPLEWIKMQDLIEEEEPDLFGIESEDCSNELNKAINNFIDQILYELEVEIYPRYISSEAEGTDLQGSIIWCVMPEYQSQINNATSGSASWSEFG